MHGSPHSLGPSRHPLPMTLSDLDAAILEFERGWWKHAGAKEAAARERFGLSPVGYYVRLDRLLDDPEALAHDPMTVRRLVRLREARRRVRTP